MSSASQPRSRGGAWRRALQAAFPKTLPVLAGFLVFGVTYGLLMRQRGFGLPWVILCSLCVFAGSMQYVGLTLLTSAFNPVYALLLTLLVNARHLFYGLSMLQRYRGSGRLKPYLVFGLIDETFSIVCNDPPPGVDPARYCFCVTALNHLYWFVSSVLGSCLGQFVTFDTTGMDFVLTALFAVIFLNQWDEKKGHRPALVGVGCTFVCLLLFGSEWFLLPAMGLILGVLLGARKWMEKEGRP